MKLIHDDGCPIKNNAGNGHSFLSGCEKQTKGASFTPMPNQKTIEEIKKTIDRTNKNLNQNNEFYRMGYKKALQDALDSLPKEERELQRSGESWVNFTCGWNSLRSEAIDNINKLRK